MKNNRHDITEIVKHQLYCGGYLSLGLELWCLTISVILWQLFVIRVRVMVFNYFSYIVAVICHYHDITKIVKYQNSNPNDKEPPRYN
jgi:hypothetical protein